MIASSGTTTLAKEISCPLAGLAWPRGTMGDRERSRGLSSAWLLVGGGIEAPGITPRGRGLDLEDETPVLEEGATVAPRVSSIPNKPPGSSIPGVLCG